MGNTSSNTSSIPKHLQPSKYKKKKGTNSSKSSLRSNQSQQQKETPQLVRQQSSLFTEEEETETFGSGPKNAFQWFEGRRFMSYNKQGGLDKNLFPNDQLELDRTRVLNYIIKWGFKGNIIAPVYDELVKGINVLNVGFGPGLWTGHHIIDLALDFRNSNFTAIDIADLLPAHFNEDVIFSDTNRIFNSLTSFSPTHPHIKEYNDYFHNASHIPENNDVTGERLNQRKVLKNLDFYQYNILEAGLPFEDNTFDFVMQQLVVAAYTLNDWIRVIGEIVRVTKPGGYIQLIEIDYHTFNLGPNGQQWETQLLNVVRQRRQLEPRMANKLAHFLKIAGLADVSSKLVSIPLGSWGLDLGELWKRNYEMFVDSTSPLLSKLAGKTPQEYKQEWETFMKESEPQKPFSNLYAAYGRKPSYPINFDTIDWSLFTPPSSCK